LAKYGFIHPETAPVMFTHTWVG